MFVLLQWIFHCASSDENNSHWNLIWSTNITAGALFLSNFLYTVADYYAFLRAVKMVVLLARESLANLRPEVKSCLARTRAKDSYPTMRFMHAFFRDEVSTLLARCSFNCKKPRRLKITIFQIENCYITTNLSYHTNINIEEELYTRLILKFHC